MSFGMLPKTCEGCGAGFLRPIPLSAKAGEKYCVHCKPIFGAPNKPLPDCSHLIDPLRMNEIKMSEVNREYGQDLDRRQRKQLAWINGFGRELETRERKSREMKIRMGGRYK